MPRRAASSPIDSWAAHPGPGAPGPPRGAGARAATSSAGQEAPELMAFSGAGLSEQDPFTVMESRLAPPRVREGIIDRAALVNRLRPTPPANVALVVAPAGYGKTTLLAELYRRPGSPPVAWLGIDERDNDRITLLTYLTLSLNRIGACDRHVVDALARRRSSFASVLARLGRSLEAAGPFTLIVDDLQLLTSKESVAVLRRLVELLPPSAGLVLASRVRPPFPLAPLRAKGRLVELDIDDLRLTDDETALLLRRTGIAVTDAEVAEVAALDRGLARRRLPGRARNARPARRDHCHRVPGLRPLRQRLREGGAPRLPARGGRRLHAARVGARPDVRAALRRRAAPARVGGDARAAGADEPLPHPARRRQAADVPLPAAVQGGAPVGARPESSRAGRDARGPGVGLVRGARRPGERRRVRAGRTRPRPFRLAARALRPAPLLPWTARHGRALARPRRRRPARAASRACGRGRARLRARGEAGPGRAVGRSRGEGSGRDDHAGREPDRGLDRAAPGRDVRRRDRADARGTPSAR